MVQLTGHNLFYSYTPDRMILNDISFRFKSGEIVSILGPNGAGKTTFLNCLANLVPLDKGEIFIDDKNIKKIPPREVAKVIGYVPQIIVPSFDFSVLEYVVTGCAPTWVPCPGRNRSIMTSPWKPLSAWASKS